MECGEVHYELEELYFTGIDTQSFVVFPFHSPESVFIGKNQVYTGKYNLTERDSTGFVGFQAYEVLGPTGNCSFALRVTGQIKTPATQAAKPTSPCNYTDISNPIYNDEPWSEEKLEYYFVPPNSNPVIIDDEEYINMSHQMPLTGYSYLFDPIVCGPNPIPYYNLKIKNDESANYRDRFYYGSLLTGTAVHVADTDVATTYAQTGLWEGWV